MIGSWHRNSFGSNWWLLSLMSIQRFIGNTFSIGLGAIDPVTNKLSNEINNNESSSECLCRLRQFEAVLW